MTMDVTLVAGPPEIHGGGGTKFKWIVPIHLWGLVRSTPTPKGADKTAPFLILAGFPSVEARHSGPAVHERNWRRAGSKDRSQDLQKTLQRLEILFQQIVKRLYVRRPDPARLAIETGVRLTAIRAVFARDSRLLELSAAVKASAHRFAPSHPISVVQPNVCTLYKTTCMGRESNDQEIDGVD